jgi:hypothetical protein
VVAGLLRDIGMVKCSLGDMAAGCQLMEESADLYDWRPVEGSKAETTPETLIKIAEVSFICGTGCQVTTDQTSQLSGTEWQIDSYL